MKTSATTRILIIDDDVFTRLIAGEALRAAGFEVIESDGGSNGLATALQINPDVILLDVMMPDIDGFQVCSKLRTRLEFARTPIIMLTGQDDSASIDAAYDCGATEFIRKPLNATLLVYRVRYAVRTSRTLLEVDRQRARLARAQRIARLGSWYWRREPDSFECTREYQRMIGFEDIKAISGLDVLLHRVHAEDRPRVTQAIDAARLHGTPYSMVYRMMGARDVLYVLHEQVEVVRDAQGRVIGIESTAQDISERIANQERIRQLAHFDSLTGLANRAQFSQAINTVLGQMQRDGPLAAVLDINIDRFVRINETFGHAAGDTVLQDIASRIMAAVRDWDNGRGNSRVIDNDLYARMNGDEFAVLVGGFTNPDEVCELAQSLINAIARPISVGGQAIAVSACVGIALADEQDKDTAALLRKAETALGSAKQTRAGTYCLYSENLQSNTSINLSIEAEIRQALELNQFCLYYQPRVDVITGHLVGAEALIRWQHPQRGLVMPGVFIPVAEDSGQIEAITEWVLQESCRQLAVWRNTGLPLVPISINFSSHSFREHGPADLIIKTLQSHELNHQLIEVEITESVMMQNIDRASRALDELRSLGIELAIDDFGTGFSSLNYLKRLPLTVLKIDRSFVKDVLQDTHDSAIAAAIIAMGEAIGLRVVAEGVETVDQANFLLARGCHLMQGFLFSRPVPPEEFARALAGGVSMPAGLIKGSLTRSAAPSPLIATTD